MAEGKPVVPADIELRLTNPSDQVPRRIHHDELSITGSRPTLGRVETLFPGTSDETIPGYSVARLPNSALIAASDSEPDEESVNADARVPAVNVTDAREDYLRHLRKNESRGTSFIRHELHELTKSNSARNLEFLCGYLHTEGISLDSDAMLGTKYKETAFHVAVLMENIECAQVLLRAGGPSLVCKPYKSSAYCGVTALHSAITKMNAELVDLILSSLEQGDKTQLIQCRGVVEHTVGKYNCPWIPLHLAASIGYMPVFETLIRHGAALWIRDEKNGNTILHTLAKMAITFPEDSVKTFQAIITNCRIYSALHRTTVCDVGVANNVEEALLRIQNKDGFTPFIYAGCLGAVDYARAITEVNNVYKFTEVELVPGSYDLYDMSEIDTAVTSVIKHPPGASSSKPNCGKLSAIEIFVYAITEDNLDFGRLPALQQALSNKWEAYKLWFLGWFVLHLIVMVMCTVSLEYRKMPESLSANSTNSANIVDPTAKGVMFFVDVFVVVVAIIYIVSEIVDVVCVLRKTFFRAVSLGSESTLLYTRLSLQGEIHRPLLWIFSILSILLFIMRLLNLPHQDILYAVTCLSGWCFMLFFTRAFENIGIFTSMLRKMFVHLLAHFSLLLLIFLLGYSTAAYAMFQEAPDGPPEEFKTIPDTFYTLFLVFVSLESPGSSDDARIPWFVKILFVMFVLHFNILLLNMLIAAMNNAYYRLEKKKTLMWLKMRTNALLMIERRLPRCMQPKHNLELYQSSDKWFIRTRNYHVQDIGAKGKIK